MYDCILPVLFGLPPDAHNIPLWPGTARSQELSPIPNDWSIVAQQMACHNLPVTTVVVVVVGINAIDYSRVLGIWGECPPWGSF